MSQIEYFAIDSPCQQLCRFNRQHICRSCYRSREEKKYWERYTDPEKRQVLRKCYYRKRAYLSAEYRLHQTSTPPTPNQQLQLFANKPTPTRKAKITYHDGQLFDESPQLPLFGNFPQKN